MASNFKNYNHLVLIFILAFTASTCFSQSEREKWKLQLAVGINNPIDPNDGDQFYSSYINFPTVNFGVQHMFSSSLGAKLDVGFNRASNAEESAPFKLNYYRINAQLVYDAYHLLNFLPSQVNLVGHLGPGVSFADPLSPYKENQYTFANVLGGIELHYGISETFSIYGDISYVFSLSNATKYDSAVDGYSFNGDLLYATIGVSIALSGCRTCYL